MSSVGVVGYCTGGGFMVKLCPTLSSLLLCGVVLIHPLGRSCSARFWNFVEGSCSIHSCMLGVSMGGEGCRTLLCRRPELESPFSVLTLAFVSVASVIIRVPLAVWRTLSLSLSSPGNNNSAVLSLREAVLIILIFYQKLVLSLFSFPVSRLWTVRLC